MTNQSVIRFVVHVQVLQLLALPAKYLRSIHSLENMDVLTHAVKDISLIKSIYNASNAIILVMNVLGQAMANV